MPAYRPDEYVRNYGFTVEITAATGKDVDVAWESVSGGELIIELTETTIGADKFQTTSPGHKSVGEITLRGAMTDKRAALCTWINETTAGKPWKRTVTITELLRDGTSGKAYTFRDCVLTRYVPPPMTLVRPEDPCGKVEFVEEVRFTYTDWTVK